MIDWSFKCFGKNDTSRRTLKRFCNIKLYQMKLSLRRRYEMSTVFALNTWTPNLLVIHWPELDQVLFTIWRSLWSLLDEWQTVQPWSEAKFCGITLEVQFLRIFGLLFTSAMGTGLIPKFGHLMCPNYWYSCAWANNVDPDQTPQNSRAQLFKTNDIVS